MKKALIAIFFLLLTLLVVFDICLLTSPDGQPNEPNFGHIYKGMPGYEVGPILGPASECTEWESGHFDSTWKCDGCTITVSVQNYRVESGSLQTKHGEVPIRQHYFGALIHRVIP